MKPINRNEPYTNPNTGVTYVFPRSYNAQYYNHADYLNVGINRMIQKELLIASMFAKAKCLKDADRDQDTTMLAIEKDEDYHGEFKTCVASTINTALAERNAVIAQRKEKALAAGESFKGAVEFTLPEDKAESMVSHTLDLLKLTELREHDHNLYKAFKAKLSGGAKDADDE